MQVVQLPVDHLHLLQKKVLVVCHHHGHPPRDVSVVSCDDGGNARDSHSCGIEIAASDVHQIPQRGQGEHEVGVVCEDARSLQGSFLCDRPVVGRRNRPQARPWAVDVRDPCKRGQRCLEIDALELAGLFQCNGLVRIDGKEPCSAPGAHCLCHGQRPRLFVHVEREREVYQNKDVYGVDGLPSTGAVTGQGKLGGEAVAVHFDEGVHSLRI
ncbi:MAG: hypothetical protein BWZ01_03141 [Deltaproteobacteria bacterium ADurb.BinA179]|nr:MAG: hypothetical protein BWZ01_03141 [Deltaproteobacteria bacterium ADurb.BinA179]